MTVHTDLFDSHIYLFRRHVLAVLERRKEISSIRTDLVPWLIRRQTAGRDALLAALKVTDVGEFNDRWEGAFEPRLVGAAAFGTGREDASGTLSVCLCCSVFIYITVFIPTIVNASCSVLTRSS